MSGCDDELSPMELAATILSEADGVADTMESLTTLGAVDEESNCAEGLAGDIQHSLRAEVDSRLPAELQIEILSLVAGCPKVVHIRKQRQFDLWQGRELVLPWFGLNDPPFNLNKQSRANAIKHILRNHTLCFTTMQDLLRLQRYCEITFEPPIALEDNIRSIAVQVSCEAMSRLCVSFLLSCTKLKEVTWVFHTTDIPVRGRLDQWARGWDLDKLEENLHDLRKFNMYAATNPADWRITTLQNSARRAVLSPEYREPDRWSAIG